MGMETMNYRIETGNAARILRATDHAGVTEAAARRRAVKESREHPAETVRVYRQSSADPTRWAAYPLATYRSGSRA